MKKLSRAQAHKMLDAYMFSKAVYELQVRRVRIWTKQEDDVMRAFYPYVGAQVMSSILARGVENVRYRAEALKLKKYVRVEEVVSDDDIKQLQSLKELKQKRGWSKKDDEVLKMFYRKIPLHDLAAKLRCSLSAVYTRAYLLGLTKRNSHLEHSSASFGEKAKK